MSAAGNVEGVGATHWTPDQGPARNRRERWAHHVWSHRLAWYISFVTSVSLALQLGVGR